MINPVLGGLSSIHFHRALYIHIYIYILYVYIRYIYIYIHHYSIYPIMFGFPLCTHGSSDDHKPSVPCFDHGTRGLFFYLYFPLKMDGHDAMNPLLMNMTEYDQIFIDQKTQLHAIFPLKIDTTFSQDISMNPIESIHFQRSTTIFPFGALASRDQAMITEQNTALSLGVDVKLVVHQEDEQDRQVRGTFRLWM